jgi:hypothetical protein
MEYSLYPRIANIAFCKERDEFHWNSLSSHHRRCPKPKQTLMENKIPFKGQDFLCIYEGVVLTKDNLAKHNCQGNKRYCFYVNDETT